MKLKDELMIDIYRSGALESQHIGSMVAVDFDGHVVAKVGDPGRLSFMRSSVKPVQAIPAFMDDSCLRHFKFDSKERAFLMSSHSGETRHQEIGADIQRRLGITNDNMGCGIHPPINPKTRDEMRRKGEEFTPLCNNCSGNHLVMLSLSMHKGWDIGDYINPEHPYQQEVLKWMSLLTGLKKDKIRTGMDNCSVPAYNLTLKQMALIFARLSTPEKLVEFPNPDNLDIPKGIKVMRRIIADFWAHPEMIGGENRLCTYLNKIGKGSFFSKAGAEGMQLTGVVDRGIGIALKITDGDSSGRAKNTAMIETLIQMGLISEKQLKLAPKNLYKPDLPNLRGFDAQTVVPSFKVKKFGL